MATDFTCWILLGCNPDADEWVPVDDLTTGQCRKLINDDYIAESTFFTYLDKDVAETALKRMKHYAAENSTGSRYCIMEMVGRARKPYQKRGGTP